MGGSVAEWTITQRYGWRKWVTPQPAKAEPRHHWFLFPHSFSGALVGALADEWQLTEKDTILDPFVGSGTTLLAARDREIPADGFDISPLSVLACNSKVRSYSKAAMEGRWKALAETVEGGTPGTLRRSYPELVRRALPDGRLEVLDFLWAAVGSMDWPEAERQFFQLAILAILPRMSHAVANGGWLRWTNEGMEAGRATECWREQVDRMLADLDDVPSQPDDGWSARLADARALPVANGDYGAVISSPPYPNRHDYTRIFGVELMFAFQDWEENRALRYQSFHSHPEARPERSGADEYQTPEGLRGIVTRCSDRRLGRMLEGYFLDMYLSLGEVSRVCRSGARVAYVVGNARYSGEELLVDEFVANVGEQVGLRCDEIRVVRWRGNSAQQMGKYGRRPARESVVIFTRP